MLRPESPTPASPRPATAVEPGSAFGELLRSARERRGLTLDDISHETKIPLRHLEALESGHLASVPGGFYRRAEVRAYARSVRLDSDVALEQLEQALQSPVSRQVIDVPHPSVPTAPTPWLARGIVAGGVLVVVILAGRLLVGLGGQGAPSPAVPSGAVATEATASPAPTVAASNRSERPVAPPSVSNAPVETAAPPAADAATRLAVNTEPPGARITVDGIGWGLAPVTIRYLPAGVKRVRVSKDGFLTEERPVNLLEGGDSTLTILLRRAP